MPVTSIVIPAIGAHAASPYRQALRFARQIHSREDIVNALEDLARLSVLNGNLDEADAAIAQLQPMDNSRGRASQREPC